jgi:hypothetical protein
VEIDTGERGRFELIRFSYLLISNEKRHQQLNRNGIAAIVMHTW